MQEAGFAAAGLNWRYLNFEVPPEKLGAAMQAMDALGMRGINLTIPHKVAVISHLDDLRPKHGRSAPSTRCEWWTARRSGRTRTERGSCGACALTRASTCRQASRPARGWRRGTGHWNRTRAGRCRRPPGGQPLPRSRAENGSGPGSCNRRSRSLRAVEGHLRGPELVRSVCERNLDRPVSRYRCHAQR